MREPRWVEPGGEGGMGRSLEEPLWPGPSFCLLGKTAPAGGRRNVALNPFRTFLISSSHRF